MNKFDFAENRWARFILALAATAIVAGFVFTTVPLEPVRTASFWLILLISGSAIVGAVGWAYSEIRRQEQFADATAARPPSGRRRVLGYLAMLTIVAAIAVGASMVPTRLAPVVWAFYVPVWIVAGWWLRRRRHSGSVHKRRSQK